MAHLQGKNRSEYVTRMFSRIAHRYDLLNNVMSGGRHHAWRRMAVEMAQPEVTGSTLDVASGTGDFALQLAQNAWASEVIALDNTIEMLKIAAVKVEHQGLADKFHVISGDAHVLPFDDQQFVCVTVGFGVRNFIDAPQALHEMTRVLRPGGWISILEIFRPRGNTLFAKLAPLYFRNVTPWIGALLAGDRKAYTYLPESVDTFLSVDQLTDLMLGAGLVNVRYRSLAFGTVAIHVGQKATINT